MCFPKQNENLFNVAFFLLMFNSVHIAVAMSGISNGMSLTFHFSGMQHNSIAILQLNQVSSLTLLP